MGNIWQDAQTVLQTHLKAMFSSMLIVHLPATLNGLSIINSLLVKKLLFMLICGLIHSQSATNARLLNTLGKLPCISTI